MRTSRVALRVESFNRAGVVNALAKENVAVFDVVRHSSREFGFYVEKKELRKTFAILDGMCYNYTAESFSSLGKRVRGVLKRAGLIAGVVVFSVLVALSRGYIWRIDVSGNETVPDKVIEKALTANHIAVGKKLSGFDSEAVAAVLRGIDGIKLATAKRVGTTIAIEVFESDEIAPPLAFSDTDILSDYDATVTRIVAREGTVLVKPGQNVFKGAPLIGAYRVTEEGAEPTHTRASGIVYGKVAFTKSVTVATEWYETVAEKTYSRTRLKLFGLTLSKKPKSADGVEIVESYSKFNAFLPVKVIRSRVTETKRVKKTADIEELAALTEERIVSEFVHEAVTNGFTESRTVRELGGGLWRVNVFIEAEMVIGGA